MATRLRSSPPTPCGGSSQTVAPLQIRIAPLPVSGAAVVATPHIDHLTDWCRECCSARWGYETADLGWVTLGDHNIPVYAFYFESRVDTKMFTQTYLTEMRLALEIKE